MDAWGLVAVIAALQHGVIARWQLVVLGLSSKAIHARAAVHGWRRLFPGVYLLPGVPGTPQVRMAAALLAYSEPSKAPQRVEAETANGRPLADAVVGAAFGPWATLSGASALFVHGLKDEPAEVDVTLRPGASLDAKARTRLSYLPLVADEIQVVDRLPVVTVERAIADLAGLLKPWKRAAADVARVIAHGDALRRTGVAAVREAAAARGGFPGRPALDHAVAGLAGTLSHSGTEAWARAKITSIAARHGLSVHPRPYPIHFDGRQVAEADVAVVEICYDVEIDGPHHLLPAQAASDRRRDRLARRAGWEVDRFLVMEIDADPRGFLAQVEARIRELNTLRGNIRS